MEGEWNGFCVENPEKYQTEKIKYGEFEQQLIYLARPKNKTNFPLVIWLHGGGLTGDGREFPDVFWNGDYATAEIRYRTSGKQFKGTDSLDDAVAAAAWLIKNAQKIGANPKQLFLGGMSAGAYLAAMVGMAPHLLRKHGLDHKQFAGLLLVSGQMTTHFQIKADLNYPQSAFEPVIDKFAPLYYVSKEIPPTIFITGEAGRDISVRPEENAFTAATLRALGHTNAEHYSLRGHDHLGAFRSCDYLLQNFTAKILTGTVNG